ncbi:Uncharacterised protein [Collinsella intestinalis]|nr:Uncharacterised protein [Collinsella intestinalis]
MQVVGLGARDLEGPATGIAALLGQAHHTAAGEVGARKRVGAGHELLRRPGAHDLAPVLAGARSHINHVIGRADRILIVLDDDHGVAQITQTLERGDESLVIALMQADGGLIQDVEHAHEARADLGRQADALGLAARKRRGGAIERQIVQADIHQEAKTLADLLDDGVADEGLALGELEGIEEREGLTAAHAANLVNGLAANRNGEHLGAQTGAVTRRAGLLADVTLELCLGVLVGRLDIALVQDIAHAGVLGEPMRVPAVLRLVIDAHLLVAQAVEKNFSHASGQVLPRRGRIDFEMDAQGTEDLRVVV